MNDLLYDIVSLDLPAVLTASFAAISCAILGNFLVLRKLSLMGDAISHAVLPGIVGAFLITGSRASLPVFIGAAAAGILTAVLVEGIRKLGKIETGAAMGVVFSILFAAGILMMEQAAAHSLDLDPDCLLHGQLELIFWFPPRELTELLTFETLRQLPNQVFLSLSITLAVCLFVILFFKELTLSAFDSALSDSLGFRSSVLHYALMIAVAGAVVASFEAVGSILVIAMLICPAASARLLTDRLSTQIYLSVAIAIATTVFGYTAAASAPLWLGTKSSLSGAGTMTVFSGLILLFLVFAAPNYGILGRKLRKLILRLNMIGEDLLAEMYRQQENLEEEKPLPISALETSKASPLLRALALYKLKSTGLLVREENKLSFSTDGLAKASAIIQAHRLWEAYLVDRLGLKPDHVHDTAMQLEHFTSKEMLKDLAKDQSYPELDPHDSPIPKLDKSLK